MDARTILEIIGWTGSGLVILSLMLADQRSFRRLNFAGSFTAAAYNAILGVWPAVGMNATIALIDLYWIVRLRAEATAAAAPPLAGVEAAPTDAPAIRQ